MAGAREQRTSLSGALGSVEIASTSCKSAYAPAQSMQDPTFVKSPPPIPIDRAIEVGADVSRHGFALRGTNPLYAFDRILVAAKDVAG